MSELLKTQLKDLNGDARETARFAGASAIPILLGHLKSESPRERALTLECLAEIKGDEAIKVLVNGLEDSDVHVRNKAVRLLHRVHGPMAIPGLRKLVAQSPDPWVRGNAALILGELDDSGAVMAIKKQVSEEVNSDTAQQMTLAIARLEDGKERDKVLKHLLNDNPRQRYNAIADLEYLSDPALVSHLIPLFSDTREVVNVGTEPFPVWHRVCDRAVDAVITLTGRTFSFPTGGRTYSPEEIQEIREFIQQSAPTK